MATSSRVASGSLARAAQHVVDVLRALHGKQAAKASRVREHRNAQLVLGEKRHVSVKAREAAEVMHTRITAQSPRVPPEAIALALEGAKARVLFREGELRARDDLGR